MEKTESPSTISKGKIGVSNRSKRTNTPSKRTSGGEGIIGLLTAVAFAASIAVASLGDDTSTKDAEAMRSLEKAWNARTDTQRDPLPHPQKSQ